jgi:hypothetical protein
MIMDQVPVMGDEVAPGLDQRRDWYLVTLLVIEVRAGWKQVPEVVVLPIS